MKKIFNKVKTDYKFKKAGEGHKLNEESTPASTSQTQAKPAVRTRPLTEVQVQAASAAIARYEDKKNPPRPKNKVYQTAKVVEPDDDVRSRSSTPNDQTREVVLEAAPVLSVLGVKFISPFTHKKLARSELRDHYREQLILRLGDDGIKASSQMIHTLNKDKEKVKIAVETLCKYLENIIKNPTERKFKKIRKGNKAFTERVLEIEGSEEFLLAVGFKTKLLKSPNNEDEEEIYYVLEDNVSEEHLTNSQYVLASTEPVGSKLSRNTTVFKASSKNMKFSLPQEFYKITPAELKKEQLNKTEQVERNKQLRTKAMREREAQNAIRKYNFTLIRVRFPGDWILQGTFRVTEKLSDLQTFIRESISHDWVPFELRTALGSLIDGEDETLAALELIPAAAVNLSWNEEIKSQIQNQRDHLGIKMELLQSAQHL